MHKRTEPSALEKDLLGQAIESLKGTAGLEATVSWKGDAPNRSDAADNAPAAMIAVVAADQRWEFSAVIKKNLTNDILNYVIAELREARWQPAVLVTRYVTPQQAERLRQANAQFIDTAGNAFFNRPPFYVLVTGNKRQESAAKTRAARFFSTSGIKLLFALLCEPALAAASFREIANAANVSLGAVSHVMEDLKSAGYLFNQEGKERRLLKYGELIRRWGEAYSERLRPKLLISRFSAEKPDWWKEVDLQELNACWSGEVAAAKLTSYLKPRVKTIYAANKLPALQLKYRFRQDRNGDIELLEKFWKVDRNIAQPGMAPALLVYADLMASGDERNIETAGMIYDRYLIRSFGKG